AGKGVVEFHLKSLPMLEGRYSVSATCHSRDQLTVYHWRENMETFEVNSDMGDVGILYIPVEINVEAKSP
ncbi:MAG: Wzt carbohydrate-binding domain-containing protein, partial [Actinomycetota bacterium]|nr:Wzt carbohydrate-binding domain-containing protein [Actinomycetota bacterium]